MSRLLGDEEILTAVERDKEAYSSGFMPHPGLAICRAQDAKTDRLSREDERRKMAEWLETKQEAGVEPTVIVGQLKLEREGRASRDSPTINCPGLSPDGTGERLMTHYVGDDCPGGHRNTEPQKPRRSGHLYHCPTNSDGTCDASNEPCDGSWNGLHCIKHNQTHTCYYCDHKGTDVNRIATVTTFHTDPGVIPFSVESQQHTEYCCDDGDACDARIKA